VDINVNHPMKLSRIAITSLVGKKKPGVVLVVASMAGYQGSFASPLYSATKHACVGFVRSMAELDRLENIKFILVAPG
jgi:NAD(P)-dependent dehydrogenase (short-subunit alcohol dehydrogenase family)